VVISERNTRANVPDTFAQRRQNGTYCSRGVLIWANRKKNVMQISETLRKESASHSAIIVVNENEVADFDAMAVMMDGMGGDYSVDVRLVSTSSPPQIQNIGGQRIPSRNHNMCSPTDYMDRKRYYEIRMSRN
jgi:hypothetical protein